MIYLKKIIILLMIIIIIIFFRTNALATNVLLKQHNQLYIKFNLDFFNRFSDSPFTEAFQRYHMLTLGYQWLDWDCQFVYDWYDQVNSETSIHTITPWGFVVKRKFNEQQEIHLNYWLVHNLLGEDDTQVVRLEYYKQFLLDTKFTGDIRFGGKLLNNTKVYPIFGGQITYADYYHFGFNYLNALDAHLVDELDWELNLPINIGITYPLNEHNRIKFDFYKYLINPSTGLNKWFVTSFEFQLWD